MLQYLAQGANMALEDAVCLAEQVVANGDDYAAAFKKYQELRYLRTARVQLMARVFGEIYHASGVNRELRNQVLSEWTAQGGVDMSWLYGHQPELPRVENVAVPQPRARSSNQQSFLQGERLHVETRRSDRRSRHREPHPGHARHRRFVRPRQHPPSRQPARAISCRARARPSASRPTTSWSSRSRAIRSTPRAASPISSASSTARPTRRGRT